MCLVQDRPYDEVARELGLSVDSVRQRVSRSRRRLRKAVSHEE
ncbi:sigma factor-like helix-turn-helix DNA-binding protein [Cnuibacter physcomitrellae]